MNKPADQIQALVNQVRGFLSLVGAESLAGDRAFELTYQDHHLFLLLDESTGKTWAAVSVWNEDEQQRVWESVLDVPSADAPPEKFFTRVIPDDLETSWTRYLTDLILEFPHDEETWTLIRAQHQIQRNMRRWLGCWHLDLEDWLRRMKLLQLAGVESAAIAVQLFRQLYLLPSDLWPVLLHDRQEELDATV